MISGFISYRRKDSRHITGRIHDALTHVFGEQALFRDLSDMERGERWDTQLARHAGACEVMLVVIGDSWLDIKDSAGTRRLDNPQDYVRREIEAALGSRYTRVLPLFVDGAAAPKADELPPSLKNLAQWQGMPFMTDTQAQFDASIAALVGELRESAGFRVEEQLEALRKLPKPLTPWGKARALLDEADAAARAQPERERREWLLGRVQTAREEVTRVYQQRRLYRMRLALVALGLVALTAALVVGGLALNSLLNPRVTLTPSLTPSDYPTLVTTPTVTPRASDTPLPATDTALPATNTPAPASDTPLPATNTPAPPTDTALPATHTPVPPTTTAAAPVTLNPDKQVTMWWRGTYFVLKNTGRLALLADDLRPLTLRGTGGAFSTRLLNSYGLRSLDPNECVVLWSVLNSDPGTPSLANCRREIGRAVPDAQVFWMAVSSSRINDFTLTSTANRDFTLTCAAGSQPCVTNLP